MIQYEVDANSNKVDFPKLLKLMKIEGKSLDLKHAEQDQPAEMKLEINQDDSIKGLKDPTVGIQDAQNYWMLNKGNDN